MGGLHRQRDVVFIGVGGGGDLLPIGGVVHRQAAFRGGRAPLAVDIQPMLTIEKTRHAIQHGYGIVRHTSSDQAHQVIVNPESLDQRESGGFGLPDIRFVLRVILP